MKLYKPFAIKCSSLKNRFKSLGFMGMTAFYNVCKSLDTTLNGFDIIRFWKFNQADENFLNKVEIVLNKLKYE